MGTLEERPHTLSSLLDPQEMCPENISGMDGISLTYHRLSNFKDFALVRGVLHSTRPHSEMSRELIFLIQ